MRRTLKPKKAFQPVKRTLSKRKTIRKVKMRNNGETGEEELETGLQLDAKADKCCHQRHNCGIVERSDHLIFGSNLHC